MGDRTDWSIQDKTANALYVMIALGAAETVSSFFWGYVIDKFTNKNTIILNMVADTVSYFFIILYAGFYDFKVVLGVLMTFFWGVQVPGIMGFLTSILGFQFTSKLTPFSVFKFLQSLLVFVCICIEIGTTN